MSKFSRTDREVSIAADEFEWDVNDYTDAHRFVIPAILADLERRGVKTVLDLGCGNGILTNRLAQAGYDVIGVDVSVSGIEMARRNYPGVTFELGDLNQPMPDELTGRFDAVVAVEVIEHLLLPRRLLASAVAALRPGGMFLLTTPYHGYLKNLALALVNKFDFHWHPLRDYGHVKFFSRRTILELVGEFGFTDVTFETVGRIPAFARSMIITGIKPPSTTGAEPRGAGS